MNKEEILNFEFDSGVFIKKLMAYFNKITTYIRCRISSNKIQFFAHGNRTLTNVLIGGDRADLKWIGEFKEDIEIEIDNADLKKHLKSVKKDEPIKFVLFKAQITPELDEYFLNLHTGHDKEKDESCTTFQITKIAVHTKFKIPLIPSEYITKTSAKTFEKKITSCDKDNLTLNIYNKGFIIDKINNSGTHSQIMCGEILEEEKSQTWTLSSLNDVLKLMCKIYDSPVKFYFVNGILIIKSYISYIGVFTLFINLEEKKD